MNAATDILGADATGLGALPRRNGELVFDAPWECRAFGAAVAMAQAGVYPFDDMRDLLIEEISRWERARDTADGTWNYYERWLAALERLLARRGVLDSTEIEERMRTIALQDTDEHDHD
ncbi:MAG: nitrile hydratase accessory protein [Actinomycetota bacterium]|nr:nitrile hydratase accessory protein [Actinomycetota bacterium]